jgi:putative PIN family toxin of toxin-antitoxin system
MRVVLDTNVLIAALIAHGTCHEVLERCIHQHEIVTSPFLFEEMRRALINKFGYSRREATEVEKPLKSRMIIVTPQPLDAPTCRDSDDDTVLGTALAGSCRCIVTGDNDLLVPERYRGIDIISPSDFWRYE